MAIPWSDFRVQRLLTPTVKHRDMSKRVTIRAPAIILSVLWIFTVYLLFYRTQEPFTEELVKDHLDPLYQDERGSYILCQLRG